MTNIASVEAMYAAFLRGDVAAVLELMADDIIWDQDAPDYGLPIFEAGTGKAQVARFFRALDGVEFIRFEPKCFLTGGNDVAVPISLRVRIKATEQVVDVLEVHLWTFGADGKASRFFHCVDRHAFVLAYRSSTN